MTLPSNVEVFLFTIFDLRIYTLMPGGSVEDKLVPKVNCDEEDLCGIAGSLTVVGCLGRVASVQEMGLAR